MASKHFPVDDAPYFFLHNKTSDLREPLHVTTKASTMPEFLGLRNFECIPISIPKMLKDAEEKAKHYSDDPMKKMRLSTSSNVRTDTVRNWTECIGKHLLREDLSPLNVLELEQLEWLLESKFSQARQRETQLMREQIEELCEKLEAAAAGSSFSVQANPNMDRAPTQSIGHHLLGEDLGPLSVKELQQLERQLASVLSKIRQRKTQLILEQLEELRKKEETNKQLQKHIEIADRAVSTILENASRDVSSFFEAIHQKIN